MKFKDFLLKITNDTMIMDYGINNIIVKNSIKECINPPISLYNIYNDYLLPIRDNDILFKEIIEKYKDYDIEYNFNPSDYGGNYFIKFPKLEPNNLQKFLVKKLNGKEINNTMLDYQDFIEREIKKLSTMERYDLERDLIHYYYSPKITLDSLESVSKEEYEQIGAEFKGGIGGRGNTDWCNDIFDWKNYRILCCDYNFDKGENKW